MRACAHLGMSLVYRYVCINVCMYECMNEWTDGWMDEWMTPSPFQSFPGYIGWKNHFGSSGGRSSRTLHVCLSSHPRSFNFPQPVAACRPLLSAKLQAFLSPGSRRLKTNFGCRLRMNVAFAKTCLALFSHVHPRLWNVRWRNTRCASDREIKMHVRVNDLPL